MAAVTAPENEELLLTAMISAAKADGTIDQGEMQKIIGKISKDSVTPEEKQFVLDQMAAPLDIRGPRRPGHQPGAGRPGLCRVAPRHRLRLLDAERAYLRDLARALGLNSETVAQLHGITGAAA